MPYWHKGFYVTINRKRENIFTSAETQIKGRYVDAGNRENNHYQIYSNERMLDVHKDIKNIS